MGGVYTRDRDELVIPERSLWQERVGEDGNDNDDEVHASEDEEEGVAIVRRNLTPGE